jgi:large repetitive protein
MTRVLQVVFGLMFGLVLVMLGCLPRTAAAQAIQPSLSCIEASADKTFFRAYFGYESQEKSPVLIQIGIDNALIGGANDAAPIATFYAGYYRQAFRIFFAPTAAQPTLRWKLLGTTVEASWLSPQCFPDASAQKISNVVALSAAANAAQGAPISVDATITVIGTATATPTGTITLDTGGASANDHCTLTLPATRCTLTPSTLGRNAITAIYSGDINFLPSNGYATVQVTQPVIPAASLQVLPSPSVWGQTVSLSATVAVTGVVSTGTVTFRDGTTIVCNAVVVQNDGASCTPANLNVGAHSFTATYLDDGGNLASSSNTVDHTVNKAVTGTRIAAVSPTSLTLGAATLVSISLTVVSPGAGLPSGSITVDTGAAGAGNRCTITLPATNCSLTPTSVGYKALTATYSGDANFSSSIDTDSLQVNATNSSISLNATPNPSRVGEAVTLAARITQANIKTTSAAAIIQAVPTGNVLFTDNGQPLATVALTTNGEAVLRVASLAIGEHLIEARYNGDAGTAAASASISQQVLAAAPTVLPSAVPLLNAWAYAALISFLILIGWRSQLAASRSRID